MFKRKVAIWNIDMLKYLSRVLFFVPIFLLFYGTNTYGLHAISLYENPFGYVLSEQWVQESPIQFFIGYPVNLIINNPTATHWIVVALGYLFLSVAIFLINKNFFNDIYIEKILYFTPFFLVIFTWMGKPDTYTVASLFLLVGMNNSFLICCLSIFILVFSHPQVALLYFLLIKYLNIFKLKITHTIIIVSSYITYYFYISKLEKFDSRFNIISNELERVLNTMFTNTIAGLMSLFMWLWVIIFLSGFIKDRKFVLSFFLIFFVSFFTLDHTRIFSLLSMPLIIYLSTKNNFVFLFKKIYDKKIMYLLGLFQIQKRGDGIIVDGRNLTDLNIFEKLVYEFMQIIQNFLT